MSKRVWKLQDFVAHSGRVHCARLGEKSGQVLATGGDDKRVNIWKVGKPHAMMSLAGHSSAVECLVFDKQEEVLVVGCAGGSMQVWNLEYRKMAGTLTGHRTACNSVEFHPYGEFFASGSADTNLKIWDLRRKSCIQTYKGHTGSITSIRFSPHGRWVATGGQDSQVKLWDLTAGKLMRDLDLHKGPITSLAFHPKEYLLATGSADRTMKLWSLESFKSVGSTDLGSSSVQAVKFYVEEQAVLSASHDALRVYPTDGLSNPIDVIDVDWRGLQDIRLCLPEEKLIGISTEGSQLGIWVADLQKKEAGAVRPSGGNYTRPSANKGSGGSASGLSSAPVARMSPPPLGSPDSVGRVQVPRRSDRPNSADGGTSGDEPRVEERRSPKPVARPEFDDPPAVGKSGAVAGLRPKGGVYDEPPRPLRLQQQDSQAQRGSTSPKADRHEPPTKEQVLPEKKREEMRSRVQDQVLQQVGYSPKAPSANSSSMFAGDLNQGPSAPPGAEQAEMSEPTLLPAAVLPTSIREIPAPRSLEEQGLRSPAANQSPMANQKSQPSVFDTNADQVSQLALQHPQMMGVLTRRLTQVRRVNQLWAQGNLGTLSDGLQFPQDHAVVCDFARAVIKEKLVGALNLDACQTLLPIMRDLMCSKYDDFAVTGHQFAELLLQHFGDLISETRESCARIPERQLDIAREERLGKCNACHQQFCEIQKSLLEGRLASRFVSFRVALQTFLQRC